jgi:hypothetical protein
LRAGGACASGKDEDFLEEFLNLCGRCGHGAFLEGFWFSKNCFFDKLELMQESRLDTQASNGA